MSVGRCCRRCRQTAGRSAASAWIEEIRALLRRLRPTAATARTRHPACIGPSGSPPSSGRSNSRPTSWFSDSQAWNCRTARSAPLKRPALTTAATATHPPPAPTRTYLQAHGSAPWPRDRSRQETTRPARRPALTHRIRLLLTLAETREFAWRSNDSHVPPVLRQNLRRELSWREERRSIGKRHTLLRPVRTKFRLVRPLVDRSGAVTACRQARQPLPRRTAVRTLRCGRNLRPAGQRPGGGHTTGRAGSAP